jgi:hypothetical protein
MAGNPTAAGTTGRSAYTTNHPSAAIAAHDTRKISSLVNLTTGPQRNLVIL